jgi:hypothetical protein
MEQNKKELTVSSPEQASPHALRSLSHMDPLAALEEENRHLRQLIAELLKAFGLVEQKAYYEVGMTAGKGYP